LIQSRGCRFVNFSPTSHHVSAKAIIAKLNAKTDNKTDTKTTRCALPDFKNARPSRDARLKGAAPMRSAASSGPTARAGRSRQGGWRQAGVIPAITGKGSACCLCR